MCILPPSIDCTWSLLPTAYLHNSVILEHTVRYVHHMHVYGKATHCQNVLADAVGMDFDGQ
jgi:hypothetical protein